MTADEGLRAPSPEQYHRRLEQAARLTLRPIGSPLPLGMLALGGASILLTGEQLSWIPAGDAREVGLAVLVFTVPLQLLASVFGFLGRDGVGGTGLGLLAGCWLVVGSLTVVSTPGSRSPTLGLLLLFAAGALLVPALAASLGKVVVGLVFLTAAVRFALTGVYQLGAGSSWEHASGWLGLGLCALALYAALALEVEDTCHRTVLPVLRWGAGRRAMQGGVLGQLEHVEQEAGVREQL